MSVEDPSEGDPVAPAAVPPDAEPPVRVEVYPGREAVVEFDPGLTFECVDSCTWCCHHGVLLYGPDLRELAERANLAETTTTVRGERFTTREAKDHEHTAEDGGACHFLDGDGLCSLHAADDWKPARCSVFPLAVRRERPDGPLRVSLREAATEHCEGLDVSERRVLDHLDAFVPPVLWELPDPDTRREL
jgi:hypothetical protein